MTEEHVQSNHVARSDEVIDHSQISIRKQPVTWRLSKEEVGPAKVFFDEFHQELIIITADCIYKSHRASSRLNQYHCVVPDHSKILRAKFSTDNNHIGLQPARHEVKIIDTRGHLVTIQPCRNASRGVYIMDFHWVISLAGDLCFVTNAGIELYKLYASKKMMKCEKTFKYDVRYSWHLARHQFYMLVNRDNIFQGVRIAEKKPEKLNKFEIVGAHNRDPREFYKRITLLSIESEVGCIYVDEDKAKIYVFRLQRVPDDSGRPITQMELTNQFSLGVRGRYRVSCVDNILVAHNLDTDMPCLLDPNDERNEPISGPLPISIRQPSRDGTVSRILRLRPNSWRFVSPKYIVEQWQTEQDCCGSFYTLELDLRAIIASWGAQSQEKLLYFLLKRVKNASKQIILEQLKEMIKRYVFGERMDIRSDLKCISVYFVQINNVLAEAVAESAQMRRNEAALAKQRAQLKSSRNSFQSFIRSQSARIMGTDDHKTSDRVSSSSSHSRQKRSSSSTSSKRISSGGRTRGSTVPGQRIVPTVNYDLGKTRAGLTIIRPAEIVNHVFRAIDEELSECHPDEIDVDLAREKFVGVLLEYTRSMHRIKLKIMSEVTDLLLKLLLDADDFFFIHQLLQYHALPDDEKLADKLLAMGNDHPPARQLGIDMLLRLGKWSKICRLLLDGDEIELGMKLFLEKWRVNRENNPESVRISEFLDAALKKNEFLFMQMYSYLDHLVVGGDYRPLREEIRTFSSQFSRLASGTQGF